MLPMENLILKISPNFDGALKSMIPLDPKMYMLVINIYYHPLTG